VLRAGVLDKSGAASTWVSPKLAKRLFVLHPNRLDYYLPLSEPVVLAELLLAECAPADAPTDAPGLCCVAPGRLWARFDGAEGEAMKAAISIAKDAAASAGAAPEMPRMGLVVSAALGSCLSLETGCAFALAGGGTAARGNAVLAWLVCSPSALIAFRGGAPELTQRGSIPLLGPAWIASAGPRGERGFEVRTERRTYFLEAPSALLRDEWLESVECALVAIAETRRERALVRERAVEPLGLGPDGLSELAVPAPSLDRSNGLFELAVPARGEGAADDEEEEEGLLKSALSSPAKQPGTVQFPGSAEHPTHVEEEEEKMGSLESALSSPAKQSGTVQLLGSTQHPTHAEEEEENMGSLESALSSSTQQGGTVQLPGSTQHPTHVEEEVGPLRSALSSPIQQPSPVQLRAPAERLPGPAQTGFSSPSGELSSPTIVRVTIAGPPAAAVAEGSSHAPASSPAPSPPARESVSVAAAAILMCFRVASERDSQALLHYFGRWTHWMEGEVLSRVEAMLVHYVEMATAESPDLHLGAAYVPLGEYEYGDDEDELSLSYTPFGATQRDARDRDRNDDGTDGLAKALPFASPDFFGTRTPATGDSGNGPRLERTPSHLARASNLAVMVEELERGMASGDLSGEEALKLLRRIRASGLGSLALALPFLIGTCPVAGSRLSPATPTGSARDDAVVSPGSSSKSSRAEARGPRALALRVLAAATQTDKRGRYTAYEVSISDGDMSWAVWRRYSQFEVLHQYMLDERGFVPGLPPKVQFALRSSVVEARRAQLERYLSELTSNLRAFTPEQRGVLGHFLNAPAALMLG